MKRLVIVLALVACTKAPEPVAEVPRAPVVSSPVVVDKARYVLDEGPYGPETTIITTLTAPAGRTVLLENCNGAVPVGLQRLEGTAWIDAWAVEMNACASAPIAVPPGESRTTTMTVASGVDAAVDSRRTETKVGAGMYRAVWYGADLPLEQRVSAPFPIEVAAPDPSGTSPRQRPAEITSVEPEHAAEAPPRAPIRVRFTPQTPLPEPPRIYVDREDVTDRATISTGQLVFSPRRQWSAGRHDIRVVYRDSSGGMRWYAWHFTAKVSP